MSAPTTAQGKFMRDRRVCKGSITKISVRPDGVQAVDVMVIMGAWVPVTYQRNVCNSDRLAPHSDIDRRCNCKL